MQTTTERRFGAAKEDVPLLQMVGISKSFGQVEVLQGIDLTCTAGTLTAICGENGAGKSTLMNILGGVFAPSAGEIYIDGQAISFTHPSEAKARGIAVIHQELNLLPHRSVADNIFLGREPVRFGMLDRRRMNRDSAAALRRLGSDIDPRTPCGALSIAEQQLVEIARALTEEARILVFDEPTAALDESETRALFGLIGELKAAGVAMLYISHRMAEIRELADRISVIKDGRRVATMAAAEASIDNVIQLMVGRALGDFFPQPASAPGGESLLSVRGGGNAQLRGIDLDVRSGEILGIAGLEGSGKAALARALAGVDPFQCGEVEAFDRLGAPRSPRQAARRGIAAIPDDRKRDGLGLSQSLRNNVGLTLRAVTNPLASATSGGRSHRRLDALLAETEVRCADFGMPVGELSGGNQQKVMFARWRAVAPRVWIVSEPTRGIDVGARAAIYRMLRGFAEAGGAVLVVSSDLMELIGLCDRIGVMAAGQLVAELPRGTSEDEIIRHAMRHDPPQVGRSQGQALSARDGDAA
ncbi:MULTISPECIES: sugar ABC transporter ATP-binding protein [Paracoccus]|jgi:ribose transport system ATP-binding protein|nr:MULTISPECIES: sugar ABC transporter ATP-binding protein [Paracoccus]MCJ1902530.1 sugar ABC transporter ATP-binding protein [Paracoccus versutus]